MKIDNLYDNGETVYLITDPEQLPRMITAVCERDGKQVSYELACGVDISWHYEFEITRDKQLPDILKNEYLS
jgi:hypothetical protein